MTDYSELKRIKLRGVQKTGTSGVTWHVEEDNDDLI